MIFLSASQEKNLYGLGSYKDQDDHEPRGDEVGVRRAVGEDCHRCFICWDLWGGYKAGTQVQMAVVAEAKDKEDDRQEEQANLWTDEPPPDPTAN